MWNKIGDAIFPTGMASAIYIYSYGESVTQVCVSSLFAVAVAAVTLTRSDFPMRVKAVPYNAELPASSKFKG